MASATDPNSDSYNDDDGFERHFKAFAGGTPLPEDEDQETGEPEGNDPEVQTDDAPAQAAASEEAPPEDVTSGDGTTDGGEQPPSEQAPDPLASLPPEARSIVEQLQRERDEARHKAASDANRVAALSRKLAMQAAPAVATPPEPSEGQKALDAKIKDLRENYGDIADPLLELLEAQKAELANVRGFVADVTAERQQAVIEAETRALEERHPDWRQIAASPDFAGWLANQPDNVQRLASSWDARESSIALTLFKTERVEATGLGTAAPAAAPTAATAATGARRSQQLDAGRDVRSRPAPAASGPPEDFDAAFAYYERRRQEKAAKR